MENMFKKIPSTVIFKMSIKYLHEFGEKIQNHARATKWFHFRTFTLPVTPSFVVVCVNPSLGQRLFEWLSSIFPRRKTSHIISFWCQFIQHFMCNISGFFTNILLTKKKIQTQTASREKLWKALMYKNMLHIKCWWNWCLLVIFCT